MTDDRIDRLIAGLDDRATGDYVVLRAELVSYGRDAVERLTALMPATGREIQVRLTWIFKAFGVEAVEPLVAILQGDTDEDVRKCARGALLALGIEDCGVFLPYFTSPNDDVRECAVRFFRGHPEQIIAAYDEILAMMSDPVRAVRVAAYNALGSGGEDILPLIRLSRRTAPQHVRPELREMLLEFVGFQGMDERDQAAIRRFIEVKALDERPEPMHLCGGWYALPTADQASVLEAFELSDPMPVTMRLGAGAWNRDHHEWLGHLICRRMYVAPVFDGWTLVFGRTPQEEHGDDADEAAWVQAVFERCRQLSDRFGEAHWYGASCGDGWTSWCMARAGEIVRYYDVFEPEQAIGESLPEERDHVLPHEDTFPDDTFPDPCYATDLAGVLSVNPEKLGPQTAVQGRGVLALTSCGRELGMPVGALEI